MQADPAATEALLHLAAGNPATPLPAFDGADLSAAALGHATKDAGWWDAELGGVRLAGAMLDGASLRRADLSRANLAGASLLGAACSGVVLRRARLEQAKFGGADLIGSDLTEVEAGEADFTGSFLEDATLIGARLRFAAFTGSVMDGADFSRADLWGARLSDATAERASFRGARMDEAQGQGADLAGADLTGASLRRADLSGARLKGVVLRDALLDGARMDGADLGNAVLPHLSLTGCSLRHVRLAGAWLERTRMRAHQLGGAVGEEQAGEFEAARDAYIVLEQNFRSLGNAEDTSWAFRRRRRMGKRLHAQVARAAWRANPASALAPGLRWMQDLAAEWVCDYGESLIRVGRTMLVVLVSFALLYWLTGCLEPRDGPVRSGFRAVDYILFSLDSMTTVGTSDTALRPHGQLGMLLSSIETVMGTVLLGLFGFVLGARMRNSA